MFIAQITHSFGGGVQTYVNSLVQHYAPQHRFIVIEKDWACKFYYHSGDIVKKEIRKSLILPSDIDLIHIHCLLPYDTQSINILMSHPAKKYLTVHDLGLICSFQHDPTKTPDPSKVKLWNEELCVKLDKIICVSQFVYHFMKENTPEIYHHKLCVISSPDILFRNPGTVVSSYPIKNQLRVACIGSIHQWKGQKIVASVQRMQTPDFRIFVIGTCAGARDCTGAYNVANLNELLMRIKPHVLWFPNICDETYCYTLSLAIATSLPIMCTAKGSFIERAQEHKQIEIFQQNDPKMWAKAFSQKKKANQSVTLRYVPTEYHVTEDFY